MKTKIFISLLFALVLLLTLAAPALAAAPIKGDLQVVMGENGTGTYSLQVTHDSRVKATVVLHGATTGSYKVYVAIVGDGSAPTQTNKGIQYFDTNDKGNGRFSGTTNPFDSGNYTVWIRVDHLPGSYLYYSYEIDITIP